MDEPGYGDFKTRHEATIWQRLNRVLGALLVIAGCLIIIGMFLPAYKKLNQSRAENERLEIEAASKKMELARLTREVNLLKTDPTYLETIARDRLDLMKEGETIFRVEPSAPPKHKTADGEKR